MNNDKLKTDRLIQETSPKEHYLKNFINAFFVGGLICFIAEMIYEMLINFKIEINVASNLTFMIVIFIGSILTGFGVYDGIGQIAGCGTIVPITGYANSMTSCAIEYKTEGILTGLVANMFKLAGSVIVTSTLVGVIFGSIGYLIGRL